MRFDSEDGVRMLEGEGGKRTYKYELIDGIHTALGKIGRAHV